MRKYWLNGKMRITFAPTIGGDNSFLTGVFTSSLALSNCWFAIWSVGLWGRPLARPISRVVVVARVGVKLTEVADSSERIDRCFRFKLGQRAPIGWFEMMVFGRVSEGILWLVGVLAAC